MKTLITILIASMFLQVLGQSDISTKKYDGNLDMMKYIHLNLDEKDILYEIRLINQDIKNSKEELAYSKNKIIELNHISSLSKDFKDIHSKANRKNSRLKTRSIFLKSDIEEFLSINNNLIYNIYEQELRAKSFLQKSKNIKTVRSYIKNANKSYKIAEKHSKKADNNCSSNEDYINSLAKANKAYNNAIKNQRYAIALCSNIDIAIIDANTPNQKNINLAQNNSKAAPINNAVNQKEENIEAITSAPKYTNSRSEELTASILSTGTSNTGKTNNGTETYCAKIIDKDIIFRIQIGAFINVVNKEQLNNLAPLFIDKSDQTFNKVLVGEHRSYRSAIKALRIIQQTTEYKDAFLVAYCSGKREPVKRIMGNGINEQERIAYINYKNNTEN